MLRLIVCCTALVLSLGSSIPAQSAEEKDFYPITTFQIPEGISLEAGALEFLPDGKLAVGTRRGEVYLVSNVETGAADGLKFERFAHGLHEVLGLAWRDGWLYVVQRPEVSRIRDTDGDGVADDYETFCDDWGINGDYHEYAFGSKFDKEGNLWVVLCLTGSFSSEVPYRGWCLRINPQGKAIPTTSGVRSPGGIGANAAGDMFYTDNQGPWNGTSGLKCLQPGMFVGHPGGNKWYDLAKDFLGTRPLDPKSDSRMMIEAKRIPELYPTSVFFPYQKMGQSASGIACDLSAGKFGPFREQLFVGELTHSTVMRVALEKVKGKYQGVAFPFRSGMASGALPLHFSPGGKLVVGETNRGWGSRGPKPFALERLDWSGKVPFEILEMRAKSDGFELEFTQPVDAATAGSTASYELETFTYIYQAGYGSPEVDQTKPKLVSVSVADDRKSVRLKIEGLQEGHIHHLKSPGVKNVDGQPLLHTDAYYTLNYIPEP
jgi:glucose/arabinose dehydrogenase